MSNVWHSLFLHQTWQPSDDLPSVVPVRPENQTQTPPTINYVLGFTWGWWINARAAHREAGGSPMLPTLENAADIQAWYLSIDWKNRPETTKAEPYDEEWADKLFADAATFATWPYVQISSSGTDITYAIAG